MADGQARIEQLQSEAQAAIAAAADAAELEALILAARPGR